MDALNRWRLVQISWDPDVPSHRVYVDGYLVAAFSRKLEPGELSKILGSPL